MDDKKVKGKRLGKQELDYIRDHALTNSDEEIAIHLSRGIKTIQKARKKIGILKTSSGKTTSIFSGDPNLDTSIKLKASQRLTENERTEFFKSQLTNSLYYDNLKQQFTKEELDYYLEEWGSLCVQFEDIVATEKRQIDELIKQMILGNRILRNIRLTEQEIVRLENDVKEHRAKNNIADDVEAQERDDMIIALIQRCAAQSHGMAVDYQKNVDCKNRLLSELNARRKDRIDHLTKAGTTFMGLVSTFRERESRESHGRYLELIRLSKEKKKSEFRKEQSFPGGAEKDCFLLDDKSQYVTEQLNKSGSVDDIFEYYKTTPIRKKILLVENDTYRIQLFQTIFKNHEISYAPGVTQAIDFLKTKHYDLVCLDYDLQIDGKGSEIAKYMKNENINCHVLIHSNNAVGAKEMEEILDSKEMVKVLPFLKIAKEVGGENAKNN